MAAKQTATAPGAVLRAERPIPAITACLIISLLDETMVMGGASPACLKNPSVIAHSALQSLPSIGAGGVAGRGAMALAPKIGYDAAAVWRAWADDLRHATTTAGHFMAEEAPGEVVTMLRTLLYAQ